MAVHKTLAQSLDWLSIQLCRRVVRDVDISRERARQAETLVHQPDYYGGETVAVPSDWQWQSARRFRFASPAASPWPRANMVRGRFYQARPASLRRPTIVLLHGWNAEAGYHTLFPWLARWLNAAGFNAVMFELPFHGSRKPARNGPGTPTNFLSGDLLHVVAAARQAVTDGRALIAWLRAQGCRQVGVWGISLGAWLAGILACVEPKLAVAVLQTPVVRLDRLIAELRFCAPLRRSMNGSPIDIRPMNLVSHQPQLPVANVLLVASEHDLFAPMATVEELCRAWRGPVLWRQPHGHISVLFSLPVMRRAIGFVRAACLTDGQAAPD